MALHPLHLLSEMSRARTCTSRKATLRKETMMSPDEITWGNLGSVAEHYVSRPAYASRVIDALLLYVGGARNGFTVADVGAGTGKLTEMLASRGLSGHAI